MFQTDVLPDGVFFFNMVIFIFIPWDRITSKNQQTKTNPSLTTEISVKKTRVFRGSIGHQTAPSFQLLKFRQISEATNNSGQPAAKHNRRAKSF